MGNITILSFYWCINSNKQQTRIMKYLKLFEWDDKFQIPWIHSVPDDKKTIYHYVEELALELGEKLSRRDEIGRFRSFRGSILGSGSYGTAFELEGNKVLKFTDHDSEVIEAYKLIGKNYKYLAKYYDVVRLTGGAEEDETVYVLVMEELKPFDENEKEFSKPIWDLYPSNLGVKRKEFTRSITDWHDDLDPDEVKAYVKKYWDNIQGMLQDCKDAGIERPDIHTGNLGRRNDGTVVFFDVSDCSWDTDTSLLSSIRTLNVSTVLHRLSIDLADMNEKPRCKNK